jgi:hypothetical protein
MEIVKLFRLDHTAHELKALEMGSRTHTHGDDIEFGHLVENMLAGPFAVFFVKLSVRQDDFIDEFAVCSSERAMVLVGNRLNLPKSRS